MVYAIIPARKGSKRIPDKNIKELCGIPLLAWTISIAQAVDSIDKVIVSTDGSEIGQLALKYGAEIISRPPWLATDEATDTDVLDHAAGALFASEDDDLVYLRPTTPTRATKTVDDAVRLWKDARKNCTGLRSCHTMPESAFKCFTIRTGLLRPITWMGQDVTDKPNQEVEPTYQPNGYIDITKLATLRNTKFPTAWGNVVVAYRTEPVIELDTPAQWNYLEWKLRKEGRADEPRFYVGRG